MKKQINQLRQSSLLAAITAILMFGAFSAGAVAQKISPGERYGSREPRTCAEMKTPARGAITAALAAKYFICQSEKIDGQ